MRVESKDADRQGRCWHLKEVTVLPDVHELRRFSVLRSRWAAARTLLRSHER